MTRWILRLAPFALALATGCLPESVEVVVLTPTTPELEQVLLAADARWEAAGVAPDRIQIGPGGVPVRLVASLGGDIAGLTVALTNDAVFRGVQSMTLVALRSADHEMGHALGIGADGTGEHLSGPECEGDVATRPLMCEAGGHVLDAASLQLACDVGACTHFTPEAE